MFKTMTLEEYQDYMRSGTKVEDFRNTFDKHPDAKSILAAGYRIPNVDGTATIETIRITRPKD